MATPAATAVAGTDVRTATPREVLMCPPSHFAVDYVINPWMDTSVPVDAGRAMAQWEAIRRTYEQLGHRVRIVDPEAGLPDMVFAANGGIVHNGRVLISNFAHPERQPEGAAYMAWFRSAGYDTVKVATCLNEGEGDVLTIGDRMLAGSGFRTSKAAHDEIREFFDIPVVTLELVDPRFYHLDTALTVLDERTVAYFPGAFSEASVAVLEELFPDAIMATAEDACGFGLNAFSDGFNVIVSSRSQALQAKLRERGFNPVSVETDELMKAGGSAKCCTLELRA